MEEEMTLSSLSVEVGEGLDYGTARKEKWPKTAIVDLELPKVGETQLKKCILTLPQKVGGSQGQKIKIGHQKEVAGNEARPRQDITGRFGSRGRIE